MVMSVEAVRGLFAFIAGMAVGSFLNACIYRIPNGLSLWWPGSRCPGCGTGIRFYDNVPLLSFVWLRGHCRQCGARIPWIYPAVELLTGIVFLGLFMWKGWTLAWTGCVF